MTHLEELDDVLYEFLLAAQSRSDVSVAIATNGTLPWIEASLTRLPRSEALLEPALAELRVVDRKLWWPPDYIDRMELHAVNGAGDPASELEIHPSFVSRGITTEQKILFSPRMTKAAEYGSVRILPRFWNHETKEWNYNKMVRFKSLIERLEPSPTGIVAIGDNERDVAPLKALRGFKNSLSGETLSLETLSVKIPETDEADPAGAAEIAADFLKKFSVFVAAFKNGMNDFDGYADIWRGVNGVTIHKQNLTGAEETVNMSEKKAAPAAAAKAADAKAAPTEKAADAKEEKAAPTEKAAPAGLDKDSETNLETTTDSKKLGGNEVTVETIGVEIIMDQH